MSGGDVFLFGLLLFALSGSDVGKFVGAMLMLLGAIK